MDEKDRLILILLKENSRYSVREIGDKLKIPPSTVHVRITRLVEQGVIERFTIQTNDKELHEEFIVFLMCKGIYEMHKELVKRPAVKEIFQITGEYNLMVKLKFAHVEEFNKFMNDFREKHKDAVTTLTMVGTSKIKEEI